MLVQTITVSYARTQSLGNYSNVKPSMSLTAELEEGDDLEGAKARLLQECRAFVEEQIDQALEADGQVAQFSQEPRYQILAVAERYGWRGFKATPPEKLIILLPNEARLYDGRSTDSERWYQHIGNGLPAHKLRLAHALWVVADYAASHDGYRVIDCADGDLTKIPAWVRETPTADEPEPVGYAAESAARAADDPPTFGDDPADAVPPEEHDERPW